MKDGIYTVQADNSDNIDRDYISANIKIKNEKVKDITFNHIVQGSPADLSYPKQVKRILKNGNTDVDVVTGATITARAVVNATNKAIELANNEISQEQALDPDYLPKKKVNYIKYASVINKYFYEKNIQITSKADVIIVGAGASGLAAAITAAKDGKKVIVLEKAGIVGGAMNRSAVILPANPTDDAFPEKISAMLIKQGENNIDIDLVNKISEKTPELFKQLQDLGVEFDRQITSRSVPYLGGKNIHLNGVSKAPSIGFGSYLTKILLKYAEKLGVQIICDHPVIDLIRNNEDEKRVVGVVTEYHKHRDFYSGKKIILATASTDSNKYLSQELSTQQAQSLHNKASLTPVYNTGDGIRLGMNIGAALSNFGNSLSLPIYKSGAPSGFANPKGINFSAILGLDTMPAINVNIYGRRYVNEDSTWGYITRANYEEEKTTGKHTYLIFCANDVGLPGMLWKDQASLDADVSRGKVTNSPIIKANSIEELAKKTGIDFEGLKRTITTWNQSVKQHRDLEYNRKQNLIKISAPYYAWQNLDYSLGAIGGLKVNANCQVIDNEGNIIPGLYATGMNAGGWLGSYYPFVGAALNGSLATGIIAGLAK